MQNPVRGLLHGSSAVGSVAGTVALWGRASSDLSGRGALLVFGLSLVCMFSVSSLYHSVPWGHVWKSRMQRIDHAMIYVLIASTYTPVAVIVLDDWLRVATLAAVWGIAAVGTAQKLWWPGLSDRYSVALQGWLAVPLLAPLFERLGGRAAGARRAALHAGHACVRQPAPTLVAAPVLLPRGLPRPRRRRQRRALHGGVRVHRAFRGGLTGT